MDNQGDDFSGGPPSGRNNNNVRGGSGLPNNMFSPNLRAIDPQYMAALDFEERIRHQLEVQQDIELRRRLMEEQQHQLLSELEYRNKIQQLQELQELQAQQQQHQQQQQGLSQLLAQNPHLLELRQQQQHHHQQQQQYQHHQQQQQQRQQPGNEHSLLASLRDDFLLQRHQQMLQDQMQQQLQEQLSRDSQQQEQEDLLAMLQASGNLRGVLPHRDISALRQQEAMIMRQQSNDQVQVPAQQQQPNPPPNPAPSAPTPVQQLEQLIHASNIQRANSVANSVSTEQGRTHPQIQMDRANVQRENSVSTDQGRTHPQIQMDQPNIQRPNSVATDQGRTHPQIQMDQTTEVPPSSTKKRSLSEATNANIAKAAPQDPPIMVAKKPKPAKESPPQTQTKPSTPKPKETIPKDSIPNGEKLLEDKVLKDLKDKAAIDEKVAQLLESQKLCNKKKQKEKAPSEKKVRKKKNKAEEAPPAKKGGRKKKTPATATATSQEGKKKAPAKKVGHNGDDDGSSKLSDHELSVIDFLGSRGKKNGNGKSMSSKKSKLNGVNQNQTSTEGKKKDNEVKGGGKVQHNYDEAADIILNFKGIDVSASEVQKAKKWSKQNENQPSLTTATTTTATYPVVPPEEIPFLSPRLKFNLPSLPIEPELTALEIANTNTGPLIIVSQQPAGMNDTVDASSNSNGKSPIISASVASTGGVNNKKEEASVADAVVQLIGDQKKIFKPKKDGKGQDIDEWWPSNASIRKERRKRDHRQDEEDTDDEEAGTKTARGDDASPEMKINFVKAGIEAAKKRLDTCVEPGVLEKLPHCKLYSEYCKEKKSDAHAPKFCCQTTETFPFEVMVCCSVCNTWRHAQCGGHYKRYTADSVDPTNVSFEAICDQCYLEKQFVEENTNSTVAATRLERQRLEHLRRANATNAVMRQVAFGKHSGQYKWPLGSVSISHISGHTRSVQARHEKAEKQWGEMATRLGGGHELRPRERQRVRTRELERLMVSIEDAEGAMDRHNMMLFLQSDTGKCHPAGFEVTRKNIFDPEDDPPVLGTKGLAVTSTDTNAKKQLGKNDAGKDNDTSMAKECQVVCARQGCSQRPRFDSMFCSDSCGVSTVETDLLRTLQYASKLHPSVLRS